MRESPFFNEYMQLPLTSELWPPILKLFTFGQANNNNGNKQYIGGILNVASFFTTEIIALLTCWRRLLALKYPLQFFPALKMIQASLKNAKIFEIIVRWWTKRETHLFSLYSRPQSGVKCWVTKYFIRTETACEWLYGMIM